jgi:hypothetical protein
MPEIHVQYRRVWQVKPYETESVELSVTDTVEVEPAKPAPRAALLSTLAGVYYRQLAEMGEALMGERLTGKQEKQVPF